MLREALLDLFSLWIRRSAEEVYQRVDVDGVGSVADLWASWADVQHLAARDAWADVQHLASSEQVLRLRELCLSRFDFVGFARWAPASREIEAQWVDCDARRVSR